MPQSRQEKNYPIIGKHVVNIFVTQRVKNMQPAVSELYAPKAVIKGFLWRGILLIMMTTCSPMIGQFFDTIIVASSDKEWI